MTIRIKLIVLFIHRFYKYEIHAGLSLSSSLVDLSQKMNCMLLISHRAYHCLTSIGYSLLKYTRFISHLIIFIASLHSDDATNVSFIILPFIQVTKSILQSFFSLSNLYSLSYVKTSPANHHLNYYQQIPKTLAFSFYSLALGSLSKPLPISLL